ncbi:hypothetical protein O181_021580 [Austropuccinia psidii MF-1]|uniref:Uncharacterized protein n=1 Tax=Austropuccinia psidii MF-1 TaxID=1389203 RepID=A0A9Q3CEV8_9BASI|nr:hypothetical protein [Austropuccinia psidii MF-1]
MEGHGSGSSAPPTTQIFIPMEHGQQEVQYSITLGRTWRKLPEDMSQRDILHRSYGNHQWMESQQAVQTPGGEGNQDKGKSSHYLSYRRTIELERAYSDSLRLTRSRTNQLFSNFQEKTRVKREKQDLFQPQAERVRPNDAEAVGLGERSKQRPEIFVNTSRTSSPININIKPTQNEHNVVTPENHLNSDQLWLQMSPFAVKTKERFDELHRSNERLKELTTLHEATIKAIQESCAQLFKSSEENNKGLNQVFEEKYNCKRDRDHLAQDINKLFNVCQNIKPQPQGHALDN